MTQKLFKIYKQFIAPLSLFVVITSMMLVFAVPVNAQSVLEDIGKKTQLPSFDTAHPLASSENGASNITSAILYTIDFLKYIMGSIAVIMIIISGLRMVTSTLKVEEVATSQKEHLKWSTFGLIIIIVADQFVKNVFFGEQGEVFSSQSSLQSAATTGSEYIKGVYSVIAYVAAALAVLMIVIAGFRLVSAGGNEETQQKSKKAITYAIVGLMLMGLAEFVVKDLIFPKQGTTLPDIEKTKMLIKNLTNFIAGFLSTISVIMFMYGGFLYVSAVGNEEASGKAKKVFIGAIIGLLLALGAYALVNTVVTLDSGQTPVSSSADANLPTSGKVGP